MQRKHNTSALVTVIALVSLAALAPSCSSSSGDDSSATGGTVSTAGHGGSSTSTAGHGGSGVVVTGGTGGTAAAGTTGTGGAGGTSAGAGGSAGATGGAGGSTAGTGGVGGSLGGTGGVGGSTAGTGGATAGSGGTGGGVITGATGLYNFDTAGNIQGWQSYADGTRTPAPVLTQSTAQFFAGTGSLKIDVSGWTDTFPPSTGAGGEGGAPPDVAQKAQATVQLNLPAIIPGKDVTMHIYMTTLTGLNYAQTFVQAKSDYSYFKSYPITLAVGWNTVHLVIPLDNPLPIVNIGVQFGLQSDYSAPIYIDEVSW